LLSLSDRKLSMLEPDYFRLAVHPSSAADHQLGQPSTR
jgi:hypothetical protein